MNVLFLTLVPFESLSDRNLYTDLLRQFTGHGHRVYVISPTERREGTETHLVKEENAEILRLRIGNTQKTNIIEKGISTVMIEPTYKKAIRRFFSNVTFDLVLYSTPPITLAGAIKYVKKRDHARTYLLLKDIFPQNAVDIGMMSTSGLKGLLYKYFRNKEKKLYALSDRIGCMSPANVKYLLDHNSEVKPKNVEVCPNSVEVADMSVDSIHRDAIRRKYNIPLDKRVFVYGGNLGKPQGIPFLIEFLKKCQNLQEIFFLIVGGGTEAYLLDTYIRKEKPVNVRLMSYLPNEDYDMLLGGCDVGMIFLDHRFTIPNFPSRLMSYMQAKLPVFACTDPNTDLGKVITDGGFGWWCESDDAEKAAAIAERIAVESAADKGEKAFRYLEQHFSSVESYNSIAQFMIKQE